MGFVWHSRAFSRRNTRIYVSAGRLTLIYSGALGVGLVAVFLAYHTELTSSKAWMSWGGGRAWVGDSVRLLMLYCLAVLLVKTSFRAGRGRDEVDYGISISPLNIVVVCIFVLTLVVLNFYYYPLYFELELLKTSGSSLSPADIALVKSDYFSQVYKPFFIYFFYAFALWIGIILPSFLVLLDGFFDDIKRTKDAIDRLASSEICCRFKQNWREQDSLDQLKQALWEMQVLSDECVTRLRCVVQRYLPALLVVVTGYVMFNILLSDAAIGPDRQFARSQTDIARSSFAWIVIIYLVIFTLFIHTFYRAFSAYRYAVTESIDCIKAFTLTKSDSYLYGELIECRTEKWDISNKNNSAFIFVALIAPGSLSLPALLLFVGTFFWGALQYGEQLAPILILEFIENTFTVPKIAP